MKILLSNLFFRVYSCCFRHSACRSFKAGKCREVAVISAYKPCPVLRVQQLRIIKFKQIAESVLVAFVCKFKVFCSKGKGLARDVD